MQMLCKSRAKVRGASHAKVVQKWCKPCKSGAKVVQMLCKSGAKVVQAMQK
jgi:hypothetical protein